jgi:dolichol-phosphate mannosyltransferase
MAREVTLSVVVPVHDEAQNLPALHARLTSVLQAERLTYELVLVDDGSRDESLEIMHALHAQDPHVTVLSLSRNFGHQVAITAGMECARGGAVVVMDADLQDPPEVVSTMLARWRSGFDVVYGVRARRHGETVFKKATAALFYRLLRGITSVELPVDAGDFRLISRRVLDAYLRLPERHRYVRGLIAWVGYRSTGVLYERDARRAGHTKFSLRKMARFALDGVVSFSTVPLRLATWLGLISLAGTATAAVLLGYWRWVEEAPVADGSAVLLALGLLGGLQLVATGVLGEYVGRTHEEVKGRPLYLIDHLLRRPAVPVQERVEGQVPPTSPINGEPDFEIELSEHFVSAPAQLAAGGVR